MDTVLRENVHPPRNMPPRMAAGAAGRGWSHGAFMARLCLNGPV